LGKCEKLYANIENTNIQKACPSIEYWAREDNLGNTFNTLGTIFRTTLSKEASPLSSPPPPSPPKESGTCCLISMVAKNFYS